ncbi:hypothetical protein FA15DRAFT_657333 [Coprinopsis marcescibilis]|uniref:F-box domain-containing protein n=1 Tax=Coprinopsis marcescibilis TaxID=230819 RepID=A0A5C3KR66_COPMA|nr:hypothetical protein FA15DRAFT_657333 [Coprinopsis marcescibilis]
MGVTQSSKAYSLQHRLPPELQMLVAGYLNSDDPGVYAMTLTIILDLCTEQGEMNVRRLSFTLDHHNPGLARYIKDLTVKREATEARVRDLIQCANIRGSWVHSALLPCGNWDSKRQESYIRHCDLLLDHPYETEEDNLPCILRRATHVKKFSLIGREEVGGLVYAPRWSKFSPELKQALTEMLLRPSVHSKTVVGIRDLPAKLLIALHSRELALSTVDLTNPFQHSSLNVQRPEDSLSVASDGGSLKLTALMSLSILRLCASPAFLDGRSIRSLEFSIDFPQSFRYLQDILDSAFDSLTDLKLDTTKLFGRSGLGLNWSWLVDGRLDLSELRLDSLDICFKTWNRGQSGYHAWVVGYEEWKWVLDILECLRTDNLKRISLHIQWDDGDRSAVAREGSHWMGWDTALARLVANGVEEVRIVFGGCIQPIVGSPWGPDNVRRHLPSLGDKLVLAYDHANPEHFPFATVQYPI